MDRPTKAAESSSRDDGEQKTLFAKIRHSKITHAAMVAGAFVLAGCSDSGEKTPSSPSDQYEGNSGGAGLTSEKEPNPENEIQPIAPELVELDTPEARAEYFDDEGMKIAKKTLEFMAAHPESVQRTKDTGLGDLVEGKGFAVIDRENANGYWTATAHMGSAVGFMYVQMSHTEGGNDYNQTIELEPGKDGEEYYNNLAAFPESVDEMAAWFDSPDDLLDVKNVETSETIVNIEEGSSEHNTDTIELKEGKLVTIEDDLGRTVGGQADSEQLQKTIRRAQEIQDGSISAADLK